MNLPIGGATRDEIARVLEQVAKDGLGHAGDLDAAIDAIGAAFEAIGVQMVVDADGDVYFVDGDSDATDAFGPNIKVAKGHFVSDKSDA